MHRDGLQIAFFFLDKEFIQCMYSPHFKFSNQQLSIALLHCDKANWQVQKSNISVLERMVRECFNMRPIAAISCACNNARFVDKDARTTFFINVIAKNALSSHTLVLTNANSNLAARMISPYSDLEAGSASTPRQRRTAGWRSAALWARLSCAYSASPSAPILHELDPLQGFRVSFSGVCLQLPALDDSLTFLC
jgi:hypothetical protein